MNDKFIKIGDFIHLHNKFGYLDTCGYVRYESHFAKYGEAGASALVQTSRESNRDHGSGIWQIVSVDGKNKGEPLLDTDRVFLLNSYPNLGCLALFDHIINDDFEVIRGAVPEFKGGAFVFTVYKEYLDKRGSMAAFNLKIVSVENQEKVISGGKVTITLDSGARAHALGLKNLKTPKKYPIGNYQTRLQAIGPFSSFDDLLDIQYPEQQTGLVVSADYWDEPLESQIWQVELASK